MSSMVRFSVRVTVTGASFRRYFLGKRGDADLFGDKADAARNDFVGGKALIGTEQRKQHGDTRRQPHVNGGHIAAARRREIHANENGGGRAGEEVGRKLRPSRRSPCMARNGKFGRGFMAALRVQMMPVPSEDGTG
jgi:hypothetical protein